MQKDPPVYTPEFVFHPEHDEGYVHFDKALDHPFQPQAGSVPRVNVWWLAEAALLSYWDEGRATQEFARAGLTSAFLRGAGTGTDCYIAWNTDAVIVAFRGTQPDEWKDVLADAKADQVPWHGSHVHRGFSDAVADIWPVLTEKLRELASGRRVWFCGHSLGAALATLAAYQYEHTEGVCTFGCPRVGAKDFALAFGGTLGPRSLRYVNDHDVVTHVPPPKFGTFTYEHVAVRRFIAEDGQVSEHGEPAIPHFLEDLIGTPSTLLEQVQSLLKIPLPLAPMFLLDHMPKAYAIWTWNDYDANG